MTADTATALPRSAIWPLPDWLKDVESEPAYGWAIQAWYRAASQRGAWFDARKAEAVVQHWPKWFKLTTDRFAGKAFRLLTWQEITVRLMVGWKRPSEQIDAETGKTIIEQVRVFSRLLLWVPRKNGKTEFLAALALLFFVFDKKLAGSEGYCFARDEDQARIPFSRMKAMLNANDALTGGATPRVTMTAKGIFLTETQSLFQLLSGKPDGKHGRMPQVIFGDEMHEWESRDMEETLRQGTGMRLEPIELYASTAGIKSRGVGYQLFEETQAIATGVSDDASTLAVIFAASPEDDWQDETAWRKANPTIGIAPTWDYLRKEAAKAKGNPRAEAAFRRYHLNQWVENVSRWLPADKWRGCAPDAEAWRGRAEMLVGRRCFGAVDAAGNLDIASLVWLFPPIDDETHWIVLPRFWVPEATLQRRADQDRATPWLKWQAEGALETTPGEVTDQNFIAAAIRQGLDMFQVERLGFDPWNTHKLKSDLVADGVDQDLIRDLRQGHQSLGEPSREFERLVFSGELDHGGHPVLGWMAGNAVVRFDANMNFVPDRKRAADKIDGIAATVMALALAIGGEGPDDIDDYLAGLRAERETAG
jgi:phage terminase large subunit-like protein